MKFRRIVSIGSSLVLLGLLLGVVFFRQDIQDYWRLRGYEPTSEIIELADETTMLDSSRRLFYVQHPALADKTLFNEHCRDHKNEFTIVLGCYISGQGIYLLDVTDERLEGVEQVTAAHELLHAAYERLSVAERKKIDALTEQAYNSQNNDRLRETVELYRQQDPSIVPNELHSILATEVRNLPAELETYYKRYFADRMAIVGFSEQYEQAFTARKNMIRQYDEQLAGLKAQIDVLQSSLGLTNNELQAQRDRMNDLKSSGQIQAYNAEVPSYNARVNRYNQDVDKLRDLVVQYNDIVQTRNGVASEEAELVEAIDSRTVIPEEQ